MRATLIVLVAFTISVGFAAAQGGAAGAENTEAFYKGKTITWVVSAEPGGPTDVVTRILVPHLGRETGSKILVKNMTGGSMEGDNWVYNDAKRDGLTLLTEGTMPLLLNDLLKSPGVQYTSERFNFLAGVDPGGAIFAVSPRLPYRTLDALKKAKGLRVGGSSAKGFIAVSGAVSSAVLGLDARVITGYKGMKSVVLATAQGEMDALVGTEQTMVREVKGGNVIALFIIAEKRTPLLPSLPTMKEFGATVPPELTDACTTIGTDSWSVALPAGVPEDRITYLRKVLLKLSGDKELQEMFAKWSGVFRPFIPGDQLQAQITRIKANKGLAEQLDSIMKKYVAAK